jgi:hypothetical protein
MLFLYSLTALPLTGSPEQQCQLTTATFIYYKCFLEQPTLMSNLALQKQLYNYTNAALKNAVHVEQLVIQKSILE